MIKEVEMMKKFKLLFVLCAMSFLTLASAGIAEAKSYKVTPSKVVKMSKKKHKKFNNKYTRHYMGLNDYLDKLQKAGGGTLTIKKGTYKISNSVYVPSNVTIILEDGVVFQKLKKTGVKSLKPSGSMWQICPHNKSRKKNSVKKYNGSKNVKFIAKGNVVFDMKGVVGIGIIAAHAQNVEISGITFKGMNGNHYIEVNGTKNVSIHDCTFTKAKQSTLKKYYNKEAINIDMADKKTGGLPLAWCKQDKTPCLDIKIENNVFDGTTRGVGTHKYSQNSKTKANIYPAIVTIHNNPFMNIYDKGVVILNWNNAVRPQSYASGSHGISGGGIEGITITGNTFNGIKRNPIYFSIQQNTMGGSSYGPVRVNITKEQTSAMMNNTFLNCGNDMNSIFAGYEVLYFRNNGQRDRANGVGIKMSEKKVYYGIPK